MDAVWANASFLHNATYLAHIQELVDIESKRVRVDVMWQDTEPRIHTHFDLGAFHWSRVFEWPWTLNEASVSSRDIVLDAGGGTSPLQFAFAKRAHMVVNYDHDQGSLDASEIFARSVDTRNVLFRRGEIDAIYYPDGYFDKVVCVSVVEHTERVEKCVQEMWRVLKPGGALLLTMDIVPRATPRYVVDYARAKKLLGFMGVHVPPIPANALKAVDDTDELLVLCAKIQKPSKKG